MVFFPSRIFGAGEMTLGENLHEKLRLNPQDPHRFTKLHFCTARGPNGRWKAGPGESLETHSLAS